MFPQCFRTAQLEPSLRSVFSVAVTKRLELLLPVRHNTIAISLWMTLISDVKGFLDLLGKYS